MAGVRRFQQAKYLKALPRVRPGESLGWMRRIGQVDQMVKTGQEAAAWEELLTLILAASGAAMRPARTLMLLQSRSVPNPLSRPTCPGAERPHASRRAGARVRTPPP